MSHNPEPTKQWWQLPFDLYDMFGYLFPGLVLWLCLGSLVATAPSSDQFPPVINALLASVIGSLEWWNGLLVILTAIVFLYATGHIVASIGAIALDRVLLTGVIGYPYRRLLCLEDELDKTSKATYKYLFVIGNLWLVVVLAIGGTEVGMLATIALAVVALLICIPKAQDILSENPNTSCGQEKRALPSVRPKFIWFAEGPLDLPLRVFVRLARLDKRFEVPLRLRIEADFGKRFGGLSISEVGTDGFWLTYDSIVQRSPSHSKAIMNFVHMFSFARNLCAALLLPVIIAGVGELLSWKMFVGFNRYIASTLICGAWLLAWRYYYLFSRYYTEYTYRAFVAINAEEAYTHIPPAENQNPPGASQGDGG